MTFTRAQVRRVFRILNGGTPTSDVENWDGEIPWATPIDLARHDGQRVGSTGRTLSRIGLSSGSRCVAAGSLILSTRAPIGYVSETTVPMAFNQGCRGLEPRSEAALDARYFRYQFSALAEQLQVAGQGSTFLELTTEDLGATQIHVPDLREQRAIADYLDTETARIDALITKKRRLIDLLDERTAELAELTILGTDQDRLVPSRSAFFDLVPTSWQQTSVRHLGCDLQTGPFGSQLHAEEYVEGGHPVVNPGLLT